MKKVIVTGAGGFIGRNLVKYLANSNIVYAILYNENEKKILDKSLNIIPIVGDLNNWEELAYQIDSNEDIDIFYHLAWQGISAAAYKDIQIQQSNLKMSINCAMLAKHVKCKKFVFVGSNQEYQVGQSTVDGTVSKASIYGVCKFCARNLCHILLRDAMEFNAAAFTNVFGVGDYSKRTANFFISKLSQGESLNLIEGNNLYDWTYIDDAVKGLIAVGFKGSSGKQYYIGSRVLPTFRKIIENVRDIICPEATLNFGTYNDKTFTDYSQFDLNALYIDTGFECKADFKESILKTAEWLIEKQQENKQTNNTGGGII